MTKPMNEGPDTTTRFAVVAMIAASLLTACGDDASETGGTGGMGGGQETGGMGGQGGDDGPAGEWSCLGNIDVPTFEDGPDVDGTSTVTDLVTGVPIEGATMTVCAYSDPDCAAPTNTGTTDSDGTTTLTMGTGEGFFVEFSADGYPDLLAFRNAPPPNGWALDFTPLSDEGLPQLVGMLGGTPDPARGHVGVVVFDCNGQAAPGVVVEIDSADDETLLGYFSPIGIPNMSLAATSTDGRVGIANVPPGPYVVTATVEATGEVISSRRGFVRAGGLSYPWQINPTPQVME